jgi:hypothetical protein
VVEAAARERIGKRLDDVPLPREVRKRRRPPLPREDLVTHRRIIAYAAAATGAMRSKNGFARARCPRGSLLLAKRSFLRGFCRRAAPGRPKPRA